MNRTDQAPEPTMEEILASIRLIISDDAKKGPSGRDDHPIRSAPPRPETAPLNSLPEEEVLDLTEALVSPEEQSLPAIPQARASVKQRPPSHSMKMLQRRIRQRDTTLAPRNLRPRKRRICRPSLRKKRTRISRLLCPQPRAQCGRAGRFRPLPRQLLQPLQDMKRRPGNRKGTGLRTFICPFRNAVLFR